MSTMDPASDHVPRVTKSLVKGPEPDYSEVDTFHFNDSDTLICVVLGCLRISFNNGKDWQTPNEFKDRFIYFVGIDLFHEGRAFVTSEGGRLHVTEDKGRSWKELKAPKVLDKDIACLGVKTHPTDRKLLLLRIETSPDRGYYRCREAIYASDNAGQNFRRILPPVKYRETNSTLEHYKCHFAVSSNESTFEHNGIYYIRRVKILGDMKSTLFYTADFGKTTKVFDELNGFSLEDMFAFPSNIIVLASNRWSPGPITNVSHSLWICKYGGDSFEPIYLPDEVTSVEGAYLLRIGQDFPPKYDQSKLLLNVLTKDCKDYSLLVLHLSDLHFSKGPTSSSANRDADFTRLHKQKNERRGRFYLDRFPELYNNSEPDFVHLDSSDTLKICADDVSYISYNADEIWKAINEEDCCVVPDKFHKGRVFLSKTLWAETDAANTMTIASFDAGKSWTKLRLLDPSGNHGHLFECNPYEDEHFVILDPPGCECCPPYVPQYEPTAGIIMQVGTVGKKKTGKNINTDDMTFISRNGGLSWEVVFEFPVYAVCLDFGNVIVAIPWGRGFNDIYSKFYFSLDQGRSWNEYIVDEPVRGSFIRFQSLGLKAVVNITRAKEGVMEYVFYSLDFSNIFGGAACTKDDLERCYLYDGRCIDGVRYSFDRRKPDAKCLVRKTFRELELHEERCES